MKVVDEIKLTQKELAYLLATHRSTISRYEAEGMPKEGRGAYPLKRVLDWLTARRAELAGEKSLTAERTRQVSLRNRILQIQGDCLRGELTEKGEVLKELSLLYSSIRITILSWVKRLPPLLAGKSERELTEVLNLEVRRVLTDLANGHNEIARKERKPNLKRLARDKAQ